MSVSESIRGNGSKNRKLERRTYQAELEMRRAVSTVPPSTTSLTPSMTDEPPTVLTRGETRDLRASMRGDDSRREREGGREKDASALEPVK